MESITPDSRPSAVPAWNAAVKVGGSLFTLSDLAARLRQWLDRRPDLHPAILVAGGGESADLVRRWADRFQLPETMAHWLAIDAMGFQASLLGKLLDSAIVDEPVSRGAPSMGARRVHECVLNTPAFLRHDTQIPVGWHVTSDSIACHVARKTRSPRVVLLKSVGPEEIRSVAQAVERSWVDPHFSEASRGLTVEWVNLRTGAGAIIAG